MPIIDFETKTPNPEVQHAFDVNPEEVLEKKSQLVLIDVRRPDEFLGELGHIPGSVLVTLDELPKKISSLPKDQTIVFICRSGARSGRAAGYAIDNDLPNVYNMKGGMISWNEKNFETEGKPS